MKTIKIFGLLLLICGTLSCDKFLEEKPRKSLVIPEKLEQLLSLLRKENESLQDPTFGEISSDDYYWDLADFNSKREPVRKAYSWESRDMFGMESLTEWVYHYRFIYHANTVLEQLPKIEPTAAELSEWNKAKGEALFYRSKFLFDMAIIWASAYNTPNIDNELGMPIRLNTNFNERSYRATLKETYVQIVKDIEESISYLPEHAEHVTRPSKLAAQAMAARVYLSMGEYEKALTHAVDVLKVKFELLDYKLLSTTVNYPFTLFNKEVILHSYMNLSMSNIYLNPKLAESYLDSDLRKALYFQYQNNGKLNFKGSYYGGSALFTGLAVDELYLIAAECYARNTKLEEAKSYLNKLMECRYKKDAVPNINGLSKEELIGAVLMERRKELLFRGLRWGDVKRLNNESRNVRLERFSSNNTVQYLEPNDPRFNLPIPEGLLHLSDITQNLR